MAYLWRIGLGLLSFAVGLLLSCIVMPQVIRFSVLVKLPCGVFFR
jgi:hypothetical protein